MVLFWGSKVKVTGSITLHNNTSFRTTIAFHSDSLGGDTSTITLQPRFVVIHYSLHGDIDKSNTHAFELYEYILVVLMFALPCIRAAF